MPEAARLVLVADSTSLKQGENALDSLARTGGRVEGKLTVDMGKIERAMASLGGVMGNLDTTMKAVERAVVGAMGRTTQETQKGARSFDDLRRAIDPAYAASARFAEVQRELATMVATGAAKQSQANEVLEVARSRYLGIQTASEAAEEAQRKQAQAVALATSNYQAMRASIDPIYAASKRYEAAIETADAALKAKIISEKEHGRVMQLAADRMQLVAPSAEKAGAATQKFGMVANQLGFQLQDVFVSAPMVGWFRAVAQQAPQAAGAFAMLGGSIGTIVPWIGTAIAVGAAVAPMFFEMGASATDAAEKFDRASKALSDYTDAASRASITSLSLSQAFRRDAIGEINNLTAGFLANAEALSFWQRAANGLSGQSVELFSGKESANIKAFEQAVGNVADRMDVSREAAVAFMAEMDRIGNLSAGSGLEDMRTHLNAVINAMNAATGGYASMNTETKAHYSQLLSLLDQTERKIEDRANAEKRGLDAINEAIGKYDQQAAMQRAIAQYGADAAQVEALKRDEAMRAAQALLEQHNISGPLADQLVRSAMAAFDAATGADTAAASLRNAEAAARGLASAIAAAAGFTANLDNQIAVIGARIDAQKAGADAAIAGQVKSLELQAAAQRDNALAAGEAAHIVEWRFQQDMQRIGVLGDLTQQEKANAEAIRESEKAANKKSRGTSDAEKAAKKAARESERLSERLDKEAEKWTETLSPIAKYQRAMDDLAQMTGRLSQDQMAKAVRNLNVELADSLPLVGNLVDAVTGGLFDGFGSTLKNMMSVFKRWLAEMAATALKNRIVVGMNLGGLAGTDALTTALGAAGAPISGAGGVLGGLTGGLSAFGGGLWGGASSVIGGLTSGGLAGGFGAVTSALGGITSGLAGLGTALGAIALPVAAVAAVFSFFRKKVKELDTGLRVTVDGVSTLVEEFRKTETKRFWGLSKKVRTSYEAADRETQDAISRVVGTLQAGVMDAAKVLGFGAETFAGFAHVMQVSTKGMSEDEALKAVQDAISGLGDDFAGMIPGLTRLAKDGETASEALSRLSGALVTVNQITDTLGHRFRAVGLTGADTASKIADAFGGLDAMAQSTQAFYGAFYSDAERLATTTRQTAKAMADLGIAMPQTRNEYRAMVAALDLTTAKGRETYAALIGMSEAFDLILPQIGALSKELAALQGAVQTGLDLTITAAEAAAQANAKAAGDWYKAAASIREYIDKLRGTASALFSPQQALAYNRGKYQATLTRAMAGDLTAAQGISGTADRYLQSVLATAKTREEAALAQARVLSDLGLLQGVGDIEGARHDVIAGLLGQQVDLMKETRDFLANGGVLTDRMIKELSGKLGGLDDAIKAAELINYQYLKERLKVTVDVIADAKIPAHLKTLLGNAATGVTGFVDFIARSDLPADMKWLALARSSEHAKTIKYLAENNLGADYTKLALKAGSRYQVNVTTALEKGSILDTDQLRKLMTGTASGKITLGGTFKFDAAAGFATWYEQASKTAITAPMDTLRAAMATLKNALDNLRVALVAPKKATTTPTPTVPVTPTKPTPTTPTKPKAYTLDDYQVRTSTVGGSNGMGDKTRIVGPLGGVKTFESHYGGSRSQALAWLKAQNYPAFALGGTHRGGPAYIGEKDLELVAPSRIYSPGETRQMLDNREIVAELKRLRDDLRAELAEVRTWTRKTAEHARGVENIQRDIQQNGVGIDPTQNIIGVDPARNKVTV